MELYRWVSVIFQAQLIYKGTVLYMNSYHYDLNHGFKETGNI